ncbi:MAG: hypothetical protein MUE64_09225 [Ignavibacteriaceae bacterium]|nr:hypothetical protein [Ignavibacteriaceae bacterium]
MIKKIIFSIALFTSIIFIYSCKTETLETKGSPEYLEEVKQWDQGGFYFSGFNCHDES